MTVGALRTRIHNENTSWWTDSTNATCGYAANALSTNGVFSNNFRPGIRSLMFGVFFGPDAYKALGWSAP
jgi:hypothetical protein